jgi:hypothetical protein
MGTTAANSRQSAVSRCRPLSQGQADGLIRLSGRIPAGGDTQSIIMSPGSNRAPRAKVRLAAPGPAPRPSRLDVTRTERPTPRTADTPTHQAPCPAAGNDPLPAGRVKGAYGAATRALRAP